MIFFPADVKTSLLLARSFALMNHYRPKNVPNQLLDKKRVKQCSENITDRITTWLITRLGAGVSLNKLNIHNLFLT